LADDVPRLSASLAFYAVLSLVPFLIVVSAIAARIYGAKAVDGQLMWEIRDLIGDTGARAIQDLVSTARQSTAAATIVGLLTLAFSASAVVMELRDALNKYLGRADEGGVFQPSPVFFCLVRERFYLFGLILGAGVLLVRWHSVW
jgi:membrane protein